MPAPWRPHAGSPAASTSWSRIIARASCGASGSTTPGSARPIRASSTARSPATARPVPSADLPAYAPVVHATSGFDLANLAYQAGRQRPDYCGVYVADVVCRHLRVRRHRLGAAPAPCDRQGPAPRRLHAREHAEHHARRDAGRPVRGAATAGAADLRAGGDRRRLHLHGRGQRAHLPGHGQRRQAARTGSRIPALPSISTGAPTGAS